MPTTAQRLSALEATASALAIRVAAVEDRLETLEGTSPPGPAPVPPPAPAPDPSPAPVPPGEPVAIHGRHISPDNTGPAAGGYTLADVIQTVRASNAPGGAYTGKRFTRGIIIDSPVTLIGCEVDGTIDTQGNLVRLEWCTIRPTTPGDWAVGPTNFSAYRTQLLGCSDGARMNGGAKGSTLIECYVRCAAQSGSDHNDGVQNYDGSGAVVVLRCNVSVAGLPGANAALFSADGAKGSTSWVDNWTAGGGYVIRAYEDTSYVIRGNEVLDRSWGFGPVAVFNPNGREFVAEDNWVVSDAGMRLRPIAF